MVIQINEFKVRTDESIHHSRKSNSQMRKRIICFCIISGKFNEIKKKKQETKQRSHHEKSKFNCVLFACRLRFKIRMPRHFALSPVI